MREERPELTRPSPTRIVSLVPSLTEALFDLGLGHRVVGVTDWCVHPADDVDGLPRVGGTKDTRVEAVLALRPDLVIANHEENTRRTVERLKKAGVPVWVTYPRTVEEGAALLRDLAVALEAKPGALEDVVGPVKDAVSLALAELPERPVRVFCPIWRDPWMSVGPDTYAHDMIRLSGGANVFAERTDRRYPIVTLDQVVAAAPEVILLPDEPYAFGPHDVAELRRLPVPAAPDRIHCIDGTWVSWYGARIRPALAALRRLLHPS